MYHDIAEQLYRLFVVNSYAAAIQQDNGKYITKYFPLSSFIIEEMLKQNGSMGCYQQGYKNDRMKWLCFDFDCPDKENPDVENLFYEGVLPFTTVLDNLSISYLTEFSGRRGIHVWIIFDTIFPKKTGYHIVQKLKTFISDIVNNPDIHIDYYPSTDSSKGNIVGKQVKFPLSCHRAGKRSYLFPGKLHLIQDTESEAFLKTQLNLLTEYIPNKIENVATILELSEDAFILGKYKYKKYNVLGNIEVSLETLESILSETKVYNAIFTRMKQGCALREDWSVLFGTLIYCDDTGSVIDNLFSTFPNYDVKRTLESIGKLRDRYFPATFGFLYELYSLEAEAWIDLEETGLSFLLKRIGCSELIIEKASELNEKININKISYTLLKEKNYLVENDEVTDAIIWNRLNSLKPYDLGLISDKVESIKNGNWMNYTKPQGLIVYNRAESKEKTRKMVSLSAEDRVLTTHIMLILQSHLRNNWHSFSYNISPCSKDQIFYVWYSSWMNYITRVQTFLTVPYLDSFHVFVMDLKGFYDHIDFLVLYRIFEEKMNVEDKNLFQFLIAYNENVMRMVNDDVRFGVPQGPAYARVIAEIFIDNILQTIFEKYNKAEFFYYRYVDDIIVYYRPDFDGEALFHDIENTLCSYGLPLNEEKSKVFGSVRYLTEKEREFISHQDKFSYDLKKDEHDIIFEEEQNRRLKKYFLSHDYDISVISYIFGGRCIPQAAEAYYEKYAEKIFEEKYGRGSYFRKFYNFLLNSAELTEQALENGYFMRIPIDTLNFSNFVHVLYFQVREKRISIALLKKIQEEYLVFISGKITNERDAGVINALLLI